MKKQFSRSSENVSSSLELLSPTFQCGVATVSGAGDKEALNDTQQLLGP